MQNTPPQNRTKAEALFFDGVRLMGAGDVDAAETCFENALLLAPDFAEAHANLGFLLEQSDVAAAERHYRCAAASDPANPQIFLNLGALLADHKRFGEAETAYRQAIALAPDAPAGWSNLGVLCACMKREAAAESCYRKALALDGDYAKARFNLSYLLLRQGRFEEGWRSLEARDWYSALEKHFAFPRWRGESLQGKSILIVGEAGHGDMIQLCRYADALRQRGAKSISILCHPPLKALFQTLQNVDEIIAMDEPLPQHGRDFWVPPLSIPYYCETQLDTIPARLPYLRAPPERVSAWAARIPSEGLRVGLVWKGSRNFENDADRSLPSLETLSPLGAVAGAHFISLQKGAGEDEAAHPPQALQPLLDLGSRLRDFADTAAVIAQLDLVICVDTAVAHLTGALAKPCWVLLPDYKTDWRWMIDRTDTPWYPGVMQLFRQPAGGGWEPVIREVAEALRRKQREFLL